jgi:hypothetical protein
MLKNIMFKNFTIKIKSSVKPVNITSQNVKADDSKTFDDIPKKHRKDFYNELKFSIMSLDSHIRLRYWLAGHSLPLIICYYDPLGFLWVYQMFWAFTGVGLACNSYEFYSDISEKNNITGFIVLG